MNTNSLKRTSNIEYSKDIIDDTDPNLTPGKVNMDVLKRRIIENQKKDKMKNKIILLSFCLSLGIIGYLIN